jgi:branched-chain amino acid transport system substrate-binding protein
VSPNAHRRSRWLVCGIVIIAACALAACGSSSSSGTSSGTSGSSVKGSPIKVMAVSVKSSEAVSLPESFSGAEAAVSAINARGGVNGHPIKLLTCDTAFDPNKQAACLKQAVADKLVSVSGMAFFPGDVTKILAPAKIPWFGGTGSIPDDATNPYSFPISEQVSEDYGVAYALAKAGAASRVVAIADPSVATSKLLFDHMNAWLQHAGYPKMGLVATPVDDG